MQINWVIYMHCNNHVPKKNYHLYKYYVHFLSTLIQIRFHHISIVTVLTVCANNYYHNHYIEIQYVVLSDKIIPQNKVNQNVFLK